MTGRMNRRQMMMLSLPIMAAPSALLAQAATQAAATPRPAYDPAPTEVAIRDGFEVGSIIVVSDKYYLYHVVAPGRAVRYGVAVGTAELVWKGRAVVGRKVEWPSWTPTQAMIERKPEQYAKYANGMPGGPQNPLGARALYLYQGGRDTMYRIHGTNDWSSIGNSGSAGCIRLFNHDIIHFYPMVRMGAPVLLRSKADSVRIEGEALANRGIDLPAYFASRESIEDGTAGQRPPVPEAMMNADGTYPPEILAQLAANGAINLVADSAGVPVDPLSSATLGI